MSDSVLGAVARLVEHRPKCQDAVPEGLMRVTSWQIEVYELVVASHEPAWGGLPAYEITVAVRFPAGSACAGASSSAPSTIQTS